MLRVMLLAGFALAVAGFQGLGYPKPAQEPVTAFVDVRVIPMTNDGVLDHQTVIVRGTRIAEAGRSMQVRAPGRAITIDGRGQDLIRGVTEMIGDFTNTCGDPKLTKNVQVLYVADSMPMVR